MTGAEIVTAIPGLVAGIVSAATLVVSVLTHIRGKRIEVNIDGKMEEFLRATRAQGFNEGVQHAELRSDDVTSATAIAAAAVLKTAKEK